MGPRFGKSVVLKTALSAMVAFAIIAFQNCSPNTFEVAELQLPAINALSSYSFPSGPTGSDIQGGHGNAIPLSPVLVRESNSSANAYYKDQPTFTLVNAAYEPSGKSLTLVVHSSSSDVLFSNIEVKNEKDVAIETIVLSNVVERKADALLANLESKKEVADGFDFTYRLTASPSMIASNNISLTANGLCIIRNSAGNPITDTKKIDDSCVSNALAMGLNIKNAVVFTGPKNVINGAKLPQSFVAKNVVGVLAGCNLSDRSGGLGSSKDGTVAGCLWLSPPPGWKKNSATKQWEFNQPINSGKRGLTTSRLVVADVLNGQLRSVSPTLYITQEGGKNTTLPVQCVLTGRAVINFGEMIEYKMTSSSPLPSTAVGYWTGSFNNSPVPVQDFAQSNLNQWNQLFDDPTWVGDYTRQLIIKDSKDDSVICVSNFVRTVLRPALN